MQQNWALRTIAALAALAAGLAGAMATGASATGALVALLAGLLAFALAPAIRQEPAPVPQAAPNGDDIPELPSAGEVMDAVDEPRLIVRDRRVLLANRAAKGMLGAHIEGADVRLAIRHPAAAERLMPQADEDGERITRTELSGLGEPDRRWEMTTSLLPDGARLVRLADRSRLYAAEQTRTDFVANASHELRTPLATLLGFLETLQDEETASDPKTRGRFLKVMYDEAARMRDLVADLMSLSRIEAERFTVPAEPVDLGALVQQARVDLQHLIEARHASIVIEQEAPEAIVAGDRAQLAQLIANLISNALKYGREGAPVRVRIEEAGNDMLRLCVIDQGEGIAPEHLPRLTERFYRVDPGRSRSVGGTGLGLAIAKHIVIRHRGRIDIRSKLGSGTTVRVYLPRART